MLNITLLVTTGKSFRIPITFLRAAVELPARFVWGEQSVKCVCVCVCVCVIGVETLHQFKIKVSFLFIFNTACLPLVLSFSLAPSLTVLLNNLKSLLSERAVSLDWHFRWGFCSLPPIRFPLRALYMPKIAQVLFGQRRVKSQPGREGERVKTATEQAVSSNQASIKDDGYRRGEDGGAFKINLLSFTQLTGTANNWGGQLGIRDTKRFTKIWERERERERERDRRGKDCPSILQHLFQIQFWRSSSSVFNNTARDVHFCLHIWWKIISVQWFSVQYLQICQDVFWYNMWFSKPYKVLITLHHMS